MANVIIVIHLMVALALIGVVLLQRSEGGGLGIGGSGGGGGGMSGFLTGRGTANLLTRTTAILAAIFMVTSMVLTIVAETTTSSSITEGLPTTIPSTTLPEEPSGPTVPVE